MYPLPHMQRSLTHQSALELLVLGGVYLVYVSLSSIYLLLPPLFGLLFYMFMRAIERDQNLQLIVIVFMLLMYESDKGYLLFSSLIYFVLIYRFVVPLMKQYIECVNCLKFLYVFMSYIGFYFFTFLLAQVFWLDTPSLDWHVIYYILIEFIIVSIL